MQDEVEIVAASVSGEGQRGRQLVELSCLDFLRMARARWGQGQAPTPLPARGLCSLAVLRKQHCGVESFPKPAFQGWAENLLSFSQALPWVGHDQRLVIISDGELAGCWTLC